MPSGNGAPPMADWQLPPVDPPPPWEPHRPSEAPRVTAPELPESPTAAVLPVPRRSSGAGGPVSPLRAVAGAAVAVAGVLLGIGALLWATDSPTGSPTVQRPAAQSALTASGTPGAPGTASAAPSSAASAAVLPVAPAPTTAAPAVAPKLPLTVLNNSTRSGLADRAAARFRAGGWPIRLTGNFRGRVEATTVYYAPGELASAQLLQKSFTGLVRVRPRFATLPGSGLTVVLTRDFPA